MDEGGWIAVYRSFLDRSHDLHPFSTGDEACRAFAWVDLLSLARWKDGGGLERGQLKMKQRTLAQRWNWSRSKVKRFLTQLEDQGRIVRDPQTGPKPTIVTVCNYDRYQFSRPQTDHKAARDPTTHNNVLKEKHPGAHARGNGGTERLECAACGAEYLRSRGRCPHCEKRRRRSPEMGHVSEVVVETPGLTGHQ